MTLDEAIAFAKTVPTAFEIARIKHTEYHADVIVLTGDDIQAADWFVAAKPVVDSQGGVEGLACRNAVSAAGLPGEQ